MKRTIVCGLIALCTHSASAQWSDNPAVNTPVCTAVYGQKSALAIGDGAGGTIIAWQDQRSDTTDLYAQRLNAAGVPQWTANGIPVVASNNDRVIFGIVPDAAGGAIIGWMDTRNGNLDVYAQRVNHGGAVQWISNGVAVCTAAGDQNAPKMISDGSGGAIITWMDGRSTANDIYAQRISSSGAAQWTADGVPVDTAAHDQLFPAIASDGSGGAIIAWMDYRNNTDYDIFAQRIDAGGTLLWGSVSTGDSVSNVINGQTSPVVLGDGSGGAIIAWVDARSDAGDVYAQRLNASGVSQWMRNGTAICTALNLQYDISLVNDGHGGAIVVWNDGRGSDFDVYAQRISVDGATLWPRDGNPVCTALNPQSKIVATSDGFGGAVVAWEIVTAGPSSDVSAQRINGSGTALWITNGVTISDAVGDQHYPTIVGSGNGGATIAWEDYREGFADIYAQMIGWNGSLGDGTATIQSVRDVRNDQGGIVNVLWNPSPFDVWPDQSIQSYEVLRGINPNSATSVKSTGSGDFRKGTVASVSATTAIGTSVPSIASTNGLYWQLVGTVAAQNYTGYAFAAPTLSDSAPSGVPYYYFMVRATTSDSAVFWDSPVDSGYSVDNLAPAVVAHVGGSFASGTETLHWDTNTEKDLAGYLIYRSTTSGFNPSTVVPLATTTNTWYVDANAGVSAPMFYDVLAVDIHGNKSVPSSEVSTVATGVEQTAALPTVFALHQNYPNPFNPSTEITYDIPKAAVVHVAAYDLLGREVAELVNGERNAGEYHVEWNADKLSSGIYYVRMESEGFVATRKLLLMK